MNNRIKNLLAKAHLDVMENLGDADTNHVAERFAELLIEDVLDAVQQRAYYTGDRDWSDEVDRPWIQLEFGYGSLHDAKSGIFK